MTKEKKCPFGSGARFCEYQRTYAKNSFTAMEGKLLFLCTLDKIEDCPELKKIVNAETRALHRFRPRRT